jgi:hypothetical protein
MQSLGSAWISIIITREMQEYFAQAKQKPGGIRLEDSLQRGDFTYAPGSK